VLDHAGKREQARKVGDLVGNVLHANRLPHVR
jgi:hypothetical protein